MLTQRRDGKMTEQSIYESPYQHARVRALVRIAMENLEGSLRCDDLRDMVEWVRDAEARCKDAVVVINQIE